MQLPYRGSKDLGFKGMPGTQPTRDTESQIIMKILIKSENFFYKKGLESLIQESALEIEISDSNFITDDDSTVHDETINIVFRDSSISINLFNKKKSIDKVHSEKCKSTLHIPFVCKNKKIIDVKWIIEKIIFIATLDSNDFINNDFYRITGLKKHEQLSLTETKIMLLLGKGNNASKISRKINRSEKTVNAHCRNASRKMKLNKKIDFYNYAKFIVTCQRNERKTLCL